MLNGAASLAVLYLANTYGWKFGESSGNALLSHVLLASFGAMALLRTSLFNLQIDNQTVPIGPSVILVSLMSAADRGVDRRRAVSRSSDAVAIMKGVSFEKAHAALPALCLTLLQNATPMEQQKLKDAVKALRENPDMTPSQKSINLGLLLMNLVGPSGLRAAVEALDDITIKSEAPSDPAVIPDQRAFATVSELTTEPASQEGLINTLDETSD
jgi:hypothetical protein